MSATSGQFDDGPQNAFLDCNLRGTAPTPPTAIYAALCTTPPLSANPVEVSASGTGYARVQISFTNFSAAANGATSNTAAITFASPTADWGTIRSIAIYDASTGGNRICSFAASPNRTVLANDPTPVTIGVGALNPQRS